MLQYSRITLQQVIDSAIRLASKYNNAINIDYTTMALLVNRAVQETLSKTLPYKYWTYISTLKINTNPYLLPNGALVVGIPQAKFIDKIKLTVSYEEGIFHEARYASAKEFFGLTDWKSRHKWNKATYENPIYTIWGAKNTAQPISYLYIAPYDNTLFNNLPSTVPSDKDWFPNKNPLEAQLDCYLLPPDLMEPNDVLPIPYEFENLVRLYATIRILDRLGMKDKVQTYLQYAVSEQKRVFTIFSERLNLETRYIESFTDTQPQEQKSQEIINTLNKEDGNQNQDNMLAAQ